MLTMHNRGIPTPAHTQSDIHKPHCVLSGTERSTHVRKLIMHPMPVANPIIANNMTIMTTIKPGESTK